MTITATAVPSPAAVGKGCTITVNGVVDVDARVEVSLSGKVRETSPVFTQGANPTGVKSQVDSLTINATSGTFTLTVDGHTTAAIAFDADAPTIQAAVNAALPSGATVAVSGTGPFTITCGGTIGEKPITISASAASLVGGTHTATIAVVTVGGGQSSDVSGPFAFGPLFFPQTGTYSIDVVAAETTNDFDEGDSLLSAPVSLTVT